VGARKTGGGGLRIPPSALLVPTQPMKDPVGGTQLGFHPGLGGLRNLYDHPTGNKVAIVQGCGYPRYNLSHEESRVIWYTGNPLGVAQYSGSGWLGRYLAAPGGGAYGPTDIPGVTVADGVAGELRTTATSVLAIRRLQTFGLPYDDEYPGDIGAKRDAFAGLYLAAQSSANPTLSYIGAAGTATLVSSEAFPPLHDLYVDARQAWSDQYAALDTGTARRFREVAKVIYGVTTGVPNINARYFELQNDGYDTHSDQGAADPEGQHYELLAEVGDAIEVFYEDLADMGVADKVCILVWSEFSRRITQNDNGTDHGSQGPMFLIGGKVKGGVYGNHPDIVNLDDEENTAYSQAAGPHRSTDFRDVYGTVMKHWLNMPEAAILAEALALDNNPQIPDDEQWKVANFDLDVFTP
jgi:uncharacterized protein (DUF1501 family)